MALESQIESLNEQMFSSGSDYIKLLHLEKEIQDKKDTMFQ